MWLLTYYILHQIKRLKLTETVILAKTVLEPDIHLLFNMERISFDEFVNMRTWQLNGTHKNMSYAWYFFALLNETKVLNQKIE